MDQILDSPSNQPRVMQYAGFWIRVAAQLIDTVVVIAAGSVVMMIFGAIGFGAMSMEDLDEDSMAAGGVLFIIVFYLLFIAAIVLYYAIMESSSRQATLGKIAVGIRVGKADGSRLSFLNALGRYLAKIISGAILYIGYIMVAFSLKKQGLHDMIADTYVFYGK
jgi:uncharacterized RDD family membrane protein YckC